MPLLQAADLTVYSLSVSADFKWSTTPALSGNANEACGKIYMLAGPSGDATIHYVGQTTAALGTRFKSGFATNGRYNYQWSRRPGTYRLFVWHIGAHGASRSLLEAVEAELVLGVRIAQKGWPMYQTGIYFRHLVDQRGQQIAPRLAIEMLNSFYEHLAANATPRDSVSLERERQSLLSQMRELILPGS